MNHMMSPESYGSTPGLVSDSTRGIHMDPENLYESTLVLSTNHLYSLVRLWFPSAIYVCSVTLSIPGPKFVKRIFVRVAGVLYYLPSTLHNRCRPHNVIKVRLKKTFGVLGDYTHNSNHQYLLLTL
eukprot:SAG22_NODE_16_length_32723_cov_26.404825_23_plen_126_part_00